MDYSENENDFQSEHFVKEWRHSFADVECLSTQNLEELVRHLNNHAIQLIETGIDERSAYLLASRTLKVMFEMFFRGIDRKPGDR